LRVRGGTRMGCITESGRRLSEDCASLGPGEDLDADKELDELHGIWV